MKESDSQRRNAIPFIVFRPSGRMTFSRYLQDSKAEESIIKTVSGIATSFIGKKCIAFDCRYVHIVDSIRDQDCCISADVFVNADCAVFKNRVFEIRFWVWCCS